MVYKLADWYSDWHSMTVEEIQTTLNVGEHGLDEEEAKIRLKSSD